MCNSVAHIPHSLWACSTYITKKIRAQAAGGLHHKNNLGWCGEDSTSRQTSSWIGQGSERERGQHGLHGQQPLPVQALEQLVADKHARPPEQYLRLAPHPPKVLALEPLDVGCPLAPMAEGRPNGRCRQLQLVKDIGDKGETEKEETDAGSGGNQRERKREFPREEVKGGCRTKGRQLRASWKARIENQGKALAA